MATLRWWLFPLITLDARREAIRAIGSEKDIYLGSMSRFNLQGQTIRQDESARNLYKH